MAEDERLESQDDNVATPEKPTVTYNFEWLQALTRNMEKTGESAPPAYFGKWYEVYAKRNDDGTRLQVDTKKDEKENMGRIDVNGRELGILGMVWVETEGDGCDVYSLIKDGEDGKNNFWVHQEAKPTTHVIHKHFNKWDLGDARVVSDVDNSSLATVMDKTS